ncbi:unnamed protein product [Lota lota]
MRDEPLPAAVGTAALVTPASPPNMVCQNPEPPRLRTLRLRSHSQPSHSQVKLAPSLTQKNTPCGVDGDKNTPRNLKRKRRGGTANIGPASSNPPQDTNVCPAVSNVARTTPRFADRASSGVLLSCLGTCTAALLPPGLQSIVSTRHQCMSRGISCQAADLDDRVITRTL